MVNQTYRKLQIILVNDGSNDNSLEICTAWRKKDSRIEIIDKENGGLSEARNYGLDRAKGNWIAFIDGDDYVKPNYINNLLKVALDSKVLLVNCGSVRIIGGHIINQPAINTPKIVDQDEFWHLYFAGKGYRGNYQAAWSKLYSRKLFDTGLRYRKGITHEDIDILYDLVNEAKLIAIIPDELYCYCQRDGSITDSINAKNTVDYMMLKISRSIYFKLLNEQKYMLAMYGLEDTINFFHYYISSCKLKVDDKNRLLKFRNLLISDYIFLKQNHQKIRVKYYFYLKFFRLCTYVSDIKHSIKSFSGLKS